MERTTELVTIMTARIMRTIFKMNLRVFGVTLLFTCINTENVLELLERELALEILMNSLSWSVRESSLLLSKQMAWIKLGSLECEIMLSCIPAYPSLVLIHPLSLLI